MLIYLLNIRDLPVGAITEMYKALPQERRQRADRIGNELARAQSVAGAWLALGMIYAAATGRQDIKADSFTYLESRLPFSHAGIAAVSQKLGWITEENGKPFANGINTDSIFDNNYTIGKLNFSISHSGNYAAAAVSDAPVGLDIQQCDDMSKQSMGRISKKFHPEEQQYLDGLLHNPVQYEQAFYRIWTAKESIFKLTGEGLRLGLGSFAVTRFADSGICHCAVGGKKAEIKAYDSTGLPGTAAIYITAARHRNADN